MRSATDIRQFDIEWNYRKSRLVRGIERLVTRHNTGVQFVTGIVALESGAIFSSLYEMEQQLQQLGDVSITYKDEEKDELDAKKR